MLLAVALGFFFDDPDQTCATDVVTKTTTEPSSSTTTAALPDTTSEVITTRDCEVPDWPRVPIGLGAVGLLLASPYVLRMFPPGSKLALGSLLSLESGTDVLADHVKQSSETDATPLLEAAKRRLATNISIADAPTAPHASDGNHDAGQ
ncbi:hypothetical protein D0Z08_17530 [Nocardioides immobilis]|uniref:Uncharacterized protein n=1 Tax=Nocardioides immobilis TaxID=2049295 RepID=A0A417XZR9_9ACTN|nr:hypothetical protein D0Z08_17530 [Nocardioides immobilis]